MSGCPPFLSDSSAPIRQVSDDQHVEGNLDGCRELFDGLAISKTDWKWEKYPVLNFDLSLAAADSANRFERNFIAVVKSTLMEVGIAYDTENTPEINFGMAIDKLAKQATERASSF